MHTFRTTSRTKFTDIGRQMELSLENDINSIPNVKANLNQILKINLFKMVAEGEESLKKGKQVSLHVLKSKLSKGLRCT